MPKYFYLLTLAFLLTYLPTYLPTYITFFFLLFSGLYKDKGYNISVLIYSECWIG
jgi:hypothetical protein